jgi:hypothetical protein
MLSDEPPETLTKSEAARLLGVSVRHLERLLVDGEVEGLPNGPRGGLQPTRRGVEQRCAQTSTPPHVELAAAPPPAAEPDAPTVHRPSAVAPANERPPRWHAVHRRAGRALSVLARGCWRGVRRRPLRQARLLLCGGMVTALLLIGASRNSATSSETDTRTLVVVTHGERGHHAVRLRCRVSRGEPLHLRIRPGRRARCLTRRARR